MNSAKAKKIEKKVVLYVFLILMTIVFFVPIFTLFATAIKSKADFYSGIGLFELPEVPALDNFLNAMTQGRLIHYMANDLFICCVKVPLGIFIEALAAYALTRLNIKHRTGIFAFFLLGMMLPMQVALVPLNIIYTKLHLINTYFGLFYVYIGFGLSFGILVLRGFFLGIPREIDEAAYIDGASKWKTFSTIIFPMAKPAVATLVITDFLSTWNEYLLASVIITDNKYKTVPVGLTTFVGEHGLDYGYLCAGVCVSIIPVIIVYLIFQRHFVEGMAGAVKA